MGRLVEHGQERHARTDGQLLRYAGGRPITSLRYDHLWGRIGRHLPWVATPPARAQTGRTVRSWPLLVLAAPAAAEVWSGWVGIALHSLVPLGLFSLIGRIHHSPGKNAHPYVRRQAAKRSTRAAVKRLSTTYQDSIRVIGI